MAINRRKKNSNLPTGWLRARRSPDQIFPNYRLINEPSNLLASLDGLVDWRLKANSVEAILSNHVWRIVQFELQKMAYKSANNDTRTICEHRWYQVDSHRSNFETVRDLFE